MTNEQAIKRFEATLGGMKKQYETYSKTTKAFYNDMYRQKGTPTYEETFEMYDLAIQSLKESEKRLKLIENYTNIGSKLGIEEEMYYTHKQLLDILKDCEVSDGD